jgi:hypothetical protein
VTCVDVAADHSRVVVGHRRGALVVWDLAKNRILKALGGAGGAGGGVAAAGAGGISAEGRAPALVSVQFLQSSNHAILAIDTKVRLPTTLACIRGDARLSDRQSRL